MTAHFIPCEIEHLVRIATPVDGSYEDTRNNLLEDPRAEHLLRTFCRALVEDGEPLAILGLQPKWSQVAIAYTLLTQEALARHPMQLTLGAHHWLRYAERELGMRRIEASVLVGYEAGIEWAERFGFRREGLMHNFGPGGKGDFYLYARTVAA